MLRIMLKICLVFWESEPQYAYKRYTYKKNMYMFLKTAKNEKCDFLDFMQIIPGVSTFVQIG